MGTRTADGRETSSGNGNADAIFPAGLVGTFRTNDFDELAAIPPQWDQEYAQLGRGRFVGRLFMAHTARCVVGVESWAPGIMIRGSIPRSTVMIAIPLRHAGPLVNRGAEVPDGRGMLLFDNETVDFLTPAPIEAFVLAADRALVERRAEVVLGRPLESLRHDDQVVIHEPSRLRAQLAAHGARLEKSLLQDASRLREPQGAAELESALIDQVLFALDPPSNEIARGQEGHRVAARAERLLRENLHNQIGIHEVCDAIDATERTLHTAFRSQFGMTPKSYLKMLRLNAARRELRRARRGETVTEIAAHWDFLHFGWFAHDYQAMFGELPSETLHHQLRCAPNPLTC